MALKVIYDDAIYPDRINLSQDFQGGQFLIFDIPGSPDDEAVFIPTALNARIPLIGNPVTVKHWDETSETNTDSLLAIPREISDSGYPLYCGFLSTVFIPLFRCYAVVSTTNLETIETTLETILDNQQKAFNLQAAIGANELAQNTALVILGTGLAPITGGISSGVVPVLTAQSLLPLLHP